MFHSFFDSESPLSRLLGRVLDIVVLSVLWLVCSLPIVTIGPASAALYYSCAKCLRHQEPGPYRNFFSAFRQNLKTGIGATVVFLLLAVLLSAGYQLLAAAAGVGSSVWNAVRVMYLVLLVIPVSVAACAFPLLSAFLLEPVFRKYTPEEELEEGMEPPWYLR